MPNILIAWELGSGLGHVGPLRAIGMELVRRGHAVAIAAPNVELCRQVFAESGVETVRAPSLPLSEKRLKFPCTYSDLLHDCGYSSAGNLIAAVGEWLELFDARQPDLLLADHSPTALLASRTRKFATASVGISFACPPDVSPLPSLRSDIPEPHWAAELERTVLANMNAALAAHGGNSLARVAEIFGATDQQYLLTTEVLDHYRRWRGEEARETKYWQPVGTLPGEVCDWPTGTAIAERPRVFVYLRQNETLLPILRGLAYKRYPTICYAPRFSIAEAASFRGSSVCVSRTPIDISRLPDACDVAMLHGGNSTVGEFLRAGVPMIVVPTMLEQQITAERVAELHAGRHAPLGDLDAIGTKLEELIEDASYGESARSIAAQISRVDEATAIGRLVDDMEQLALAQEHANTQSV